jgi:hypothetical protein
MPLAEPKELVALGEARKHLREFEELAEKLHTKRDDRREALADRVAPIPSSFARPTTHRA